MYTYTPRCQRCDCDTIIADAGIFRPIEYYYCPQCKAEVNGVGIPLKGDGTPFAEFMVYERPKEPVQYDDEEMVPYWYDTFPG
jgi:hypothetical protein